MWGFGLWFDNWCSHFLSLLKNSHDRSLLPKFLVALNCQSRIFSVNSAAVNCRWGKFVIYWCFIAMVEVETASIIWIFDQILIKFVIWFTKPDFRFFFIEFCTADLMCPFSSLGPTHIAGPIYSSPITHNPRWIRDSITL